MDIAANKLEAHVAAKAAADKLEVDGSAKTSS
jgi:hypothetical protein